MFNPEYESEWVESLLTELAESYQSPPEAVHRFNPAVAHAYGIPAALVFQHISARCEKSGLGWAVATLNSLRRHYLYLGRTTLYHGLTALVRGTDRAPAMLRRRPVPDTAQLYQYGPYPGTACSASELRAFNTSLAQQLGVFAALVYATLECQSQCWNPTDVTDDAEFRQVVGWCHKRHSYLSKQTIRRAVNALLEQNLVRKELCGTRIIWTLPQSAVFQN
jgi:hypothetical protein